MRVTVEVLGHIRNLLPEGESSASLDLPEGSTVGDALRAIGVPDGEQWNAGVDGQLVDAHTALKEGNRLLVFTPIGGGCQYKG